MKTIWKYEIAIADEQVIQMPGGAEILTVQVQHGTPCIWAIVDSDNASNPRRFRMYGTGHKVDETGTYVGTFHIRNGTLVFHLFVIPEGGEL